MILLLLLPRRHALLLFLLYYHHHQDVQPMTLRLASAEAASSKVMLLLGMSLPLLMKNRLTAAAVNIVLPRSKKNRTWCCW